MHYHRSVGLIKIHSLHHSESLHSLLLHFLFMKRWEITKVVLINCNSFYLLRQVSGQIPVNMIVSEPAIKIINKWNTFYTYVCSYIRTLFLPSASTPFESNSSTTCKWPHSAALCNWPLILYNKLQHKQFKEQITMYIRTYVEILQVLRK